MDLENEDSGTATTASPTVTTEPTTTDTDIGDDAAVETKAPEGDSDPATQSQDETAATPFAEGKEKFVVDGKEHEWDWPTVKKYAQLGKAATQRMQEAAALKKRVETNWKQLVNLAHTNPNGLIEVLTGNKGQAQAGKTVSTEGQPQAERDQAPDWRDEEIRQLKARVEEREIAEERRQIESELSAAVKAYPILDNKIYTDYVKSQYARALRQGMDVTLDDVAFHVAQELEDQKTSALKQKQAKLKEKRERAPVSAPPAHRSDAPKEMSMEDVKRLAGRA